MRATLENMRKYADIPGLVILDNGDEYSANYGDYFFMQEGAEIPGDLVIKRTRVSYIEPYRYVNKPR
ncbi:MAG: hypothetical protein ACRDFB_05240 [Rhabdochlamydiaceae bacterium]